MPSFNRGRDVSEGSRPEPRHDLAGFLDEVRKGRTVVITDRGRPIARRVPVRRALLELLGRI